MRQKQRPWLPIFLAILVAAGLSSPASARRPSPGEVAPDFELTLVDGQKVQLADLRGKVVILNFWATWCAPCKRELPLLDAYYAINRKHGLEVFAITTEDSLPIHKLKVLFAALNLRSVRRMKGPYKDLAALPTNYVIDRKGHTRHSRAGAFTLDDLNRIILPLLKEKAP